MTDIQILTLAVSITFPALGIIGAIAALMYSNKRVDDAGASMNNRLDDMKAELIRHMDNGFEHMELLLKLHEAEHHK